MNRVFLTCVMLLSCFAGYAQITIEDCYVKARANYPLIRQYDLIEKSKEYSLSNADKGYLPQVLFSAKASYQSEVTEFPISIPGVAIKGLNKDQYGATLDVSQTIWDGGAIRAKKAEAETESEVNKANLNVNLYHLNERVNQLYFGILLFEERVKQNDLLQEELQRNYEKLAAYLKNGVASQADVDAIKVEQVKAMQSKSQLIYTKKAYADMLSILMGETITEDTKFEKPKALFSQNNEVYRPELQMIDAQIRNMEAKKQEISAGLMPKIGLFLTGGYGRPGLNMLENDFSAYYIGGVRFSWDLSGLYTNKNSKKLIDSGISTLHTQRNAFLFNTSIDVASKKTEIEKYRDQLKFDNEIIALMNSIKQASEVKMANGTISGVDLMRDVNAEDTARQNKILHEIEMLLAIYNLKYVTNN